MATLNMTELMIKAARVMNGRYSLNGRPLTMEEAFAPTGILPGIAKRADQLASLCLGYGLGVTFEDAEGSLLGISVTFDELTPNALRLLCMIDVLNELMRGTRKGDLSAMDQLLYD